MADQVRAAGVTIETGATFLFSSIRRDRLLPPGVTFVVLDNTGSAPISGTFARSADGGTITAGPNTLQANYEGGDGNDLTLTVVP